MNLDNTENKLYYEKDIEYILKVKVEIICFIWCSTDNVEICSLEKENVINNYKKFIDKYRIWLIWILKGLTLTIIILIVKGIMY